MKLVIQIPCRDEAESLPTTLAELPRTLAGFDAVECVVVDDGSTDGSAEIARAAGADEVVRMPGPRGLAAAFNAGLEASLRRGADVVVNTDADNQYRGADVAALVGPILAGTADMVVGERPLEARGASILKRGLQSLGSAVVRRISGTTVPDATSGFRAFTREAALRVNVFTTFSYSLETIIQLGLQRSRVVSVPIRVNPVTRPSRLFRRKRDFLARQGYTLVQVYALYRPFELFATLGAVLVALGLVPGVRFLVLFALGEGQGHVQSLILSLLLIVLGGLSMVVAFLAGLSAANRVLLEDVRLRLRRRELDGKR
jgi:glycosyltransferase involved in cell wall biosynthesis